MQNNLLNDVSCVYTYAIRANYSWTENLVKLHFAKNNNNS